MEHCLDCDYKWQDEDQLLCIACNGDRQEQELMAARANRYAVSMCDPSKINGLGQVIIDNVQSHSYLHGCYQRHGKDRFDGQVDLAFKEIQRRLDKTKKAPQG